MKVGGRSPNAAVQILMGLPSSSIAWRVSRASLFLKLANAPVGSWRHLAFIAHHNLQSAWFVAAFADLSLVLPGVRLIPTCVGTLPFLSSSGSWSDVGSWVSFHTYALPVNISGLRYCPSENSSMYSNVRSPTRKHVRDVSHQLHSHLTREFWSALYNNVVEVALVSEASKLGLLALRLQHPGPPIHFTLDCMTVPSHRVAFASFLCADWFFGKYAKNYFARNLLPKTREQLQSVQAVGVTDNTVCLACWHFRRLPVLEDEYHVACACPEYARARRLLLANLPGTFHLNSRMDLLALMSCSDAPALTLFGQFLVEVRQRRRKLKVTFERFENRVCTQSFACKRAAWR